jgi:hypothetical protein
MTSFPDLGAFAPRREKMNCNQHISVSASVSRSKTSINRLFRCSLTVLAISTASFFVSDSPASAASVFNSWTDNFSIQVKSWPYDRFWKYEVDTQIILGADKLEKGQETTFDYTQTYKISTDPMFLGLTYGHPDMVPGNLFPTQTAPKIYESMYPIHFQHELFAECCIEFSALTSATLKTNSPATGGINSISIGPIGVGGSGTAVGDTSYNAHQTETVTWVDWTTTSSRGGFFFGGGSFNFKGKVKATSDSGIGKVTTRNAIWLSGFGSWYPEFTLNVGNDKMLEKHQITHSAELACVPTPPAIMAYAVVAAALGAVARTRAKRPAHATMG